MKAEWLVTVLKRLPALACLVALGAAPTAPMSVAPNWRDGMPTVARHGMIASEQRTTRYVDRDGNAVAVTYTINDWFGADVIAPGTGFFLNDGMDDFTDFGMNAQQAVDAPRIHMPLTQARISALEANGYAFRRIREWGSAQAIVLDPVTGVLYGGTDRRRPTGAALGVLMITPDWLTAISTLLTLVVVAVTALAAVRQIRHMRSGNQVAALLPLTEKYSTSEIRASLDYVIGSLRHDLEDPEVREGVRAMPASGKARQAMVCLNFYESVGALVRAGTLDLFLVLLYFTTPADVWDIAADYIALTRSTRGNEVFENFEALVILQKRYEAKHGTSLFPRTMKRLELPNSYPEG